MPAAPTKESPVRLVHFATQSAPSPRPGLQLTEGVIDLTHAACELPAPEHPMAWFDLDAACLRGVLALGTQPERVAALAEGPAFVTNPAVRLQSPVPRPGKVLCIGLNYRDHARESKMDLPDEPLIFSKFPSCVVGPGAEVILPPGAEENEYEAELGVVIGRRAHRVDEVEAAAAVLGYTCVNDVSARDFQFKDGQWQRGKSPDTFCPTGPAIVTTDECTDPHVLPIRFRLNGETLQDSNTNEIHHQVPRLVSYISQFATLEPGDLIATGTPPGVGFARKPPVYLKDGDRMEVDIEGLGVLANPVVRR